MRTTLARWTLRLAGAALLAASAAIHLDLYLTGYRTIPTIGPLFLAQVVAAFTMALAIVAVPLISMTRPAGGAAAAATEAVVAAVGAVVAAATLGGYLLTVWVGLFGFHEVRSTAGTVCGILEIAAFAALATLATASADLALTARAGRAPASMPAPDTVRVHPAPAPDPLAPGSGVPASRDGLPPSGTGPRAGSGAGRGRLGAVSRGSLVSVAVLTVAAAGVFGGSVATASGAGGPAPAGAAGASALLRTTSIGGVSVLTNASGRTLYWFAPDTPSSSACYGECVSYWPPVTGSPAAGPGVAAGKLGTIKRTGGTLQATYAGHPLYTYIGDSARGQANGNDINLNGGYWHEVKVTGG